ncbi:carbohydrate porin, partial [Xanthomonas sp. Kuri4-2]
MKINCTATPAPHPFALALLGGLAALLAATAFDARAQAADAYTGKTLTGDWGGRRSEWAADGIAVRGGFITEAMGVVDGGIDHSARNAFQTQVGVDLDMGRLTSFWGDGRFHLTVNDRRGRGTSQDLAGNDYMPIQEIYSDQFTRLTELSYDQNFLARKLNWKAGFYVIGNDFGINQIMTNFVNAAFCAHPLAFMANSGWYNYPAARWGVEGAQQLAPAFNVRVGWFQVNPRLGFAARDTYAFRPFASGTTGSLFPLEATWKPGGGGRHPGVYKFGGYYDSSRVASKGLDPSPTTGRHGAYVLAEQKLYAPGGDRDRGLTAFAQYLVSDHATAQITRWYALGGVYQGIGRRDHDRIAL